MEVAQRSPVPVGIVRSRTRPGAYALVVKVTYELAGGTQGAPASEQAPLRDLWSAEAEQLLFPVDLVEGRDACDVVLAGRVLAAEGPVIAKIGSLHLRSHRAAELGPVDEETSGRPGSFARPEARVPFPSFPLSVEVQGGGWFRSGVIDAPRPMAALVIRGDWESPSPLALQIDGVAVDPFASRVELVLRAYFQHPGDVDRDVIAIVDVGASLARTTAEERASWHRDAAVEPVPPGPSEEAGFDFVDEPTPQAEPADELEPQETIPALVLPGDVAQVAPKPVPVPSTMPPEPHRPAVRPPMLTLPADDEVAAVADDAPLPFERSKARTAPADPRRIPANPLPFVKPAPPAPPPPAPPVEPARATQPPPPLDAGAGAQLPFGPPARQKSVTMAPPPSRAEALPFRAAPASAPQTAPAVIPRLPPPSAVPFPAFVPVALPPPVHEDRAAASVRIEGLTLDEYAAIRASLWAESTPRKQTLKRHGLSELRWRVVERRWERHLDEAGPEALAPLVDLLAAFARRDVAASP